MQFSKAKAPSYEGKRLTVFILAGGESTRMGRDKARLALGNRSFLQVITEMVRALGASVEVIFDDVVPRCGPIGGVLTAFAKRRFDVGLFLSCDMPLITVELLKAVIDKSEKGEKAVFTKTENGMGFPFVLPRNVRGILNQQIKAGRFSIQELAGVLGARSCGYSGDPDDLRNVNTPADYKHVLRIWNERRKSDAMLEVRNLVIRRGSTHLISGFNWKVQKGEHWVILGPNGCGKTSLFAALLGYLSPTAGDVFVLGEEFGNSDWPELRKKIGLVSSSVRQMMAEDEPAWITVASGKYAMIDFWGTPKKR
ncbi:MAG TPA: NTP transferase domain-containing protein, partial [Candidatus Kapabacteria bacterium]|nr:NTP transferase domain-containing protein [Candidatus Kapabacteria bacterium]